MRILVVDDHPMYLEAAQQHLARCFDKSDVLTATSLAGAIAIIAEGSVDLVLLDYGLPDVQGAEGVRRVVAAAGETPVAVTSGLATEEVVRSSIAAGAKGFIPKTIDGPAFASAATLILRGGTSIPCEFLGRASQDTAAGQSSEPGAPLLGQRELLILQKLVAGASNKEIARLLDVQEATIKLYLTHIFRKIGAKNRSQAAAIATRKGLVPAD